MATVLAWDVSTSRTLIRPALMSECADGQHVSQLFDVDFFTNSHSGREQPHVGPQLPLQAGGVRRRQERDKEEREDLGTQFGADEREARCCREVDFVSEESLSRSVPRESQCHLSVVRVRPLSDGSNPWSTSLVKSQKSVPLAALFAEQGERPNIVGDV